MHFRGDDNDDLAEGDFLQLGVLDVDANLARLEKRGYFALFVLEFLREGEACVEGDLAFLVEAVVDGPGDF